MRMTWAMMAALVGAAVALGQAPADQTPVVRYGITSSPDFYPQTTAKDTLGSVAKALANKRYEYVAAHLLDPELVDAKVAERASELMPATEKSLAALRAEQRRNPAGVTPGEFVPLAPDQFAERVRAEATRSAFDSVVRSILENQSESPENVRLLDKFVRQGVFTDGGTTATVALKDVPGKQVYLKQVGGRWYIEDRQQPDLKPKADR